MWPHNQLGKAFYRLHDGGEPRTPHTMMMTSGGYWVASAIRNSSDYTADLSSACAVFVDLHCYESWWFSTQDGNAAHKNDKIRVEPNQIMGYITTLLDYIGTTPRFNVRTTWCTGAQSSLVHLINCHTPTLRAAAARWSGLRVHGDAGFFVVGCLCHALM